MSTTPNQTSATSNWRRPASLAAAAVFAMHQRPDHGDRGEGIVSVAIAVLIMAALGVVAYGAFDALFNNTTTAAESQISSIGG